MTLTETSTTGTYELVANPIDDANATGSVMNLVL